MNARPALPVISAPASVESGASGIVAEVVGGVGPGWTWTITNGTITSGAGTSRITFSTGDPGVVVLDVVEKNAKGCDSPAGHLEILVKGPDDHAPRADRPRRRRAGRPSLHDRARALESLTLPRPGRRPVHGRVLAERDRVRHGDRDARRRPAADHPRRPRLAAREGARHPVRRLAAGRDPSGDVRRRRGGLDSRRLDPDDHPLRRGPSGPLDARRRPRHRGRLEGLALRPPRDRRRPLERRPRERGRRGKRRPEGLALLRRGRFGSPARPPDRPPRSRPVAPAQHRPPHGRVRLRVTPSSSASPGPPRSTPTPSSTTTSRTTARSSRRPRSTGSPAPSSFRSSSRPAPSRASSSWPTRAPSRSRRASGSRSRSRTPAATRWGASPSTSLPASRRSCRTSSPSCAGSASRSSPPNRDYAGTLAVTFSAGGEAVGRLGRGPHRHGGGRAPADTASSAPPRRRTRPRATSGSSVSSRTPTPGRTSPSPTRRRTSAPSRSATPSSTAPPERRSATSEPITLAPGAWTQLNGFLSKWKVENGYVRVERVDGTAPFLAYAVVNDGGVPGKGTGDGSFVEMSTNAP